MRLDDFNVSSIKTAIVFTLKIRGRLNGLRAANSDSPLGMMRWKEQDYEQHSDDFS